ncbi:type IV secretory system conjugative DNA transfer family protein [Clavibacter tessellarius]|uniref:type IV secretory system conjugative DNA transfer family protein n=1 Tax=Clavibacter tessellarius TaxID=31965 RepID=UPI003251FD9E
MSLRAHQPPRRARAREPGHRHRDVGDRHRRGILASAWAGLAAAHALTGEGAALPADPLAVAIALKKGEVAWTPLAVVVAAVVAAALTALTVVVARALRRLGRGRTRVDRSARYLASTSDLDELRERASSPRPRGWASPGARACRSAATSAPAACSTRRGGRVGLHRRAARRQDHLARGARDPRGARRAHHHVEQARRRARHPRPPRPRRHRVGLRPAAGRGRGADLVVGSLSSVVDDTSAAKLAGHFASGSREPDDRGDAFFDAAGKDLLAGLLLAAALDRRPITDVLRWLTDPDEREMVAVLRRGGYPLIADDVESASRTSPRQRDGVYATARKMASCVRSSRVSRWVTPAGGDAAADPRPRLDPDAFVRGSDTLYSLSVEGEGTAVPLVTALTVAIVEAAERLARTQPGGRLATPLVCVLDEAANVCRWKDLPDLYSHLGSRGIPVLSVFQSYAQGVDVFGREGMRKLFSAANEVVYLGGVKEAE